MSRIIIADDHAIVRKGLIQILSLEDNLNLSFIDEADSGEELLEKVRKEHYDLIILDISMPGIGGVEALKELKSMEIHTPVLILSTFSEDQFAIRVLRAGAAGYVRKNNRPDELIRAIQVILKGKKYYSDEITEKILDLNSSSLPHEQLSDREFQILIMLAVGKTQKDIAGELYLSIKTVNTYRRRILDKMKMENNNDLTEYAMRNGLVEV
jgi:two-component system, NarL family, invasion response regulator UvrY